MCDSFKRKTTTQSISFFSGSRNVSSDANLLTFRVPIYVMDLPSVPTGVSRDVAYVLTMGSSKLWTGIHTIKINEFQPLPSSVDPTNITVFHFKNTFRDLKYIQTVTYELSNLFRKYHQIY